jgi:hypothetical protein
MPPLIATQEGGERSGRVFRKADPNRLTRLFEWEDLHRRA